MPEFTTDLHKNHLLYDHSTSLSNFKTLGYILYNILLHNILLPLLYFYASMFYVLCYYVLCDNVFILICVCRVLIKGYLLTYLLTFLLAVE